METKITPSSYGPIILYRDIAVHLSDQDVLIHVVDEDPTLLRRLQDSVIEFFSSINLFTVESLPKQAKPDVDLINRATHSLELFHSFAHVTYRQYLEKKVSNEKSLPTKELEKLLLELHPEAASFYKISK